MTTTKKQFIKKYNKYPKKGGEKESNKMLNLNYERQKKSGRLK